MKKRNATLVETILDAVGNTPVVRLSKLSSGKVFAKAEYLNPGGSIKDRVGKAIIETAERDSRLKPGMTVIEATSGNTGIGLALVGRLKGYPVICVMPDNASAERKKIIEALGGRIVFTPAAESLSGALAKMKEMISAEPETYFVANQFVNPANPAIHYETTAREIWDALGGEIDIKKVASSATVKTNGGNIKLSGSNGPVNAVTMGGNIDLYKVSGPVQVKTFAGDIYTELEAVGKSSSKISTLSGNISLYINPSEKATIKCEAKNASYGSGEKAIVSDFNPESYKESQYSGFTDASYNLNGGGQQISLSTLNGGIKIKKLK